MLRPSEPAGFRHEAVFYAGDEDFVAQLLPFLRDAVRAAEPVLVAVGERKLERLRDELGRDAAAVELVALDRVGVNPGRIISLWHDFVARHAPCGRPLRGIGEPIWPGRDADELEEAHRHEALLNVAFGAGMPFTLWCPYDVSALHEDVVAEARRTHPSVRGLGGASASDAYPAAYEADPFRGALAEPVAAATELAFDDRSLRDIRDSSARSRARRACRARAPRTSSWRSTARREQHRPRRGQRRAAAVARGRRRGLRGPRPRADPRAPDRTAALAGRAARRARRLARPPALRPRPGPLGRPRHGRARARPPGRAGVARYRVSCTPAIPPSNAPRSSQSGALP